ncbi:MAG: hypothetical protein LBQ57_12825, partial [Spirochaetales bacterium]|nr:hypothetical protein [Spirochaetales bacterium]
ICPAIPKSIQIVSNLNAFTHKKRFQTAIPYLVAWCYGYGQGDKKSERLRSAARELFLSPRSLCLVYHEFKFGIAEIAIRGLD